MDLYTLDSMLRRERVIDKYKSLIWTERWQKEGDLELVLESTSEFRKYLAPGTWLSLDRSYRVMKVETAQDVVNDDGDKVLSISGHTIEIILDDRVARQNMEDLTTTDEWYITDDPKSAVQQVFGDVCVTGALDTADIIPYYTSTPIFPTENIPAPVDSVVNTFPLGSILEAIKPVCEAYDMGFRLCRNPDSNMLHFDVYMGSDRTTNQEDFPPVVFGPEFDNIRNTTELVSTAGVKNVAYVFSPVGFEIVYSPDVDPTVQGFERRVLMVRADDIEDVVPANATAKMIDRGLEELAMLRDIAALDGEVSQTSEFVYDTDYFLGDIIELRSRSGNANFMRVTEQIFINDEEGVRSYPTLTIKKLISPDTWLGWPNMTWFDLDGDTLHWDEA